MLQLIYADVTATITAEAREFFVGSVAERASGMRYAQRREPKGRE